MTTRSCFVLKRSSGNRLTAEVIPIPEDMDAQAFIQTIQDIEMQNISKKKQFFKKYAQFKKAVVSVATLRPITVEDLSNLPNYNALVQTVVRDEALTQAVADPGSMDRPFVRHFWDLYEDIFVEVGPDDNTTLPRQAVLVHEEMGPRAKRILGALASVVSGLVWVIIKVAESN